MPSKNCIIRCHVRTRFVLLLLIALHTSNNLCVIYWSKVLDSTILWHVTMELEPFWSRIWTFDMYVCMYIRYRPRFFYQVGHQTTSAYIENKHFFTKSWTTSSKFAKFVLSKSFFVIKRIFLNFFFCEKYLTRRSTFTNEIFWKLWFLKYFGF